MSKSRQEEERSMGGREVEAPARPDNAEPWNPLDSVRKTISPTQRLQLLKMQVPVLPPEDFLDTVQLRREQSVRSRRFRPLVFALGMALLVLLFLSLWLRFRSTASGHDASAPAPTPFEASRPASVGNASPAVPAPPELVRQSRPTAPDSNQPLAKDHRPSSNQTSASSHSAASHSAASHSAASHTPPASTQPPVGAKAQPQLPDAKAATSKSREPSSPAVTGSDAGPPQPNTSIPAIPEPAPSGIKFWTQPR
jgi:cytoskeletal protein RodZ